MEEEEEENEEENEREEKKVEEEEEVEKQKEDHIKMDIQEDHGLETTLFYKVGICLREMLSFIILQIFISIVTTEQKSKWDRSHPPLPLAYYR